MTIKHILTLMLGVALFQTSGCTLLSRPAVSSYGVIHSYDGVSASYSGTALARQTVDELTRHYPPGRTSLILVKAPGSFGESLETALRQQGFSVVSPDATAALAGVTLGYQLDEVAGENTCYLQVSASDGVRFGFVKSLSELAINEVLAPPIAQPASTSVETMPLSPTPESPVSPLPAPAPLTPVADAPAIPARTHTSPVAGTPTRLATGVLTSLPPNWRYTIPDASRRSTRVNKPSKSSTWRESIQSMAEQAGCAASFDENARRVTIIAYDDAPLPEVSAQESPQEVALPLSPAPSPATITAATATFSTSAVVSTALHDVASLPSPMPKPDTMTVVESKPSTEQWDVTPGSLFSQLNAWCDRAGYQLVWKASHDLDMEAHAIFRGTFSEAVGRLFQGLHKSGNALRVTIYTANNVVEISEE